MLPQAVPGPYGRDAELGAISAAMSNAHAANQMEGLVLVGPAGAGKTTLWREAIRSARQRGVGVLACAPAAFEASLGLSALADLLRAVPEDRIDALPGPQRNALRAVLLEEEPDGTVSDRATSAGLLTLLDDLAHDGPVCLAVDDIQWMDRSSQRAIGFALRRLADAPVFLLATLREGPRAGQPAVLGTLPEAASRALRLGTLSIGAVHHVLRSALDATFPRPTLVKITEWSGGNPLLAIEIGRSILAAGGTAGAIGRAPLGGPGVQRFLGRRIASLPAEQRRTLLVVALAEHGSREQIDAVHARLGWRTSLPDPSTGLIEETDATIHLAHPLFAEAVLAAASAHESATVRRTLALITERSDVRARHLAEVLPGPDEDIALSLDAAAVETRARGAVAEAVDLAELAVLRSPPDSSRRHARRLLYADLLSQAGDLATSARVLEEARVAASNPADQAAVILRLARQGLETQPASHVTVLCREAIRLAGPDSVTAAQAHLIWAEVTDPPTEGAAHVRNALGLLGPEAPARLRAQAMILDTTLRSVLGRRVDLGPIEAALDLDAADPPERVTDRAQFARAWLLLLADDLSRAREDLIDLRRAAEDAGDESSLPQILANRGHLEIRAGNWMEARAVSFDMLEIADRSGQRIWSGLAHVQLGSVAALLGEGAVAERHFDEAHAIGVALEDAFVQSVSVEGRAMLALGSERYEDAAALLAQSGRGMGGPVPDPGMTPWPGLGAEVLARVGRLAEAVVLTDDIEARARRARRRRALAAVLRIRALIASAKGELDLGATHAQQSCRILAGLPTPFDHGRSLLVLGAIQRRRRERRASDATLAQAGEIFGKLGAVPWICQAAAERARIGLRPRAPAGLTPTEAEVARLSAEGRTNREVAQAAFMSPKTVEANLARVYRKLGIRTRAELGRSMAGLPAGTDGEQPTD